MEQFPDGLSMADAKRLIGQPRLGYDMPELERSYQAYGVQILRGNYGDVRVTFLDAKEFERLARWGRRLAEFDGNEMRLPHVAVVGRPVQDYLAMHELFERRYLLEQGREEVEGEEEHAAIDTAVLDSLCSLHTHSDPQIRTRARAAYRAALAIYADRGEDTQKQLIGRHHPVYPAEDG